MGGYCFATCDPEDSDACGGRETAPCVPFGTVGIYALTAAISGWMEAPISWLERILLAATGTALLWPTGPVVNVPGFVFFLALFTFNLWRGRRSRRQAAAASATRSS